MKKKIVSVFLTTALMASCLAGCGGNGDNAPADNTSSGTAETQAATSTEEKVGAQITVDKSATDNVKVEGDYSGADLTVFIYAQDHEKTVY